MKPPHSLLLLALMAALFLTSKAYSQPPPPPPPVDTPTDAPIDGGLSLLLAAGAAYGVKRYRGKYKQSEESR